jgi:hypothetical protein
MTRTRTRRSIAAVVAVSAVAGGLATSGVASAADTLTARLTAAAEPDGGKGSGSARLTLDRDRGRVCFRIQLKGTGPVVAGHIHKGRRGEAGPVFIALFDGATRRPRGCVNAGDGVTKAQIRAVVRNPRGYYVNVHSEEYPDGTARGQLRK